MEETRLGKDMKEKKTWEYFQKIKEFEVTGEDFEDLEKGSHSRDQVINITESSSDRLDQNYRVWNIIEVFRIFWYIVLMKRVLQKSAFRSENGF